MSSEISPTTKVLTRGDVIKRLYKEKYDSIRSLSATSGVSERLLAHMIKGYRESADGIRGFEYRHVQTVALSLGLDFSAFEIVDTNGTKDRLGTEVDLVSNEYKELSKRVRDAMYFENGATLRRSLSDVDKRLKSLYKSSPSTSVGTLRAFVLRNRANLALKTQAKKTHRRNGIKLLNRVYSEHRDIMVLVQLADALVDLHYDNTPKDTEDRSWMRGKRKEVLDALRKADDSLDASDEDGCYFRVRIRTQAASIYRCHAIFAETKDHERNFLDRMWRCSKRALGDAPDSALAKLCHAQSIWRTANSDEDLMDANKMLEEAARYCIIAKLVYARFLRQTYRRKEAVSMFKEYEATELERHRKLGEAYLLAEAVWQESYEGDGTNLQYAEGFLLEALEAGYEDMRNISALAFLRAEGGDVEFGVDTFKKVVVDTDSSWQDAINAAKTYIESGDMESLRRAFVVGLDEADSWNRIGTFFREYMRDDERAMDYYRTGLKLDPRHTILWLNLARVQVSKGSKEYRSSIGKAKRYNRSVAFKTFIEEVEEEGRSKLSH